MLVKLMGLGDIFAAVMTIVATMHPVAASKQLIGYAAAYLVLKGGIFSLAGNIVSYIDVLCGVYIFLLSLGISLPLLTLFAVLFLVQKTAFSFFA
ncbi:hypothetical protein KY320_03635 [Candidatus Woesearchaeota archaeon]|nr:hypothetical protein [Candidatus Woesearchaeota archaeon]